LYFILLKNTKSTGLSSDNFEINKKNNRYYKLQTHLIPEHKKHKSHSKTVYTGLEWLLNLFKKLI